MRAPLGGEWNTARSQAALTAPRVTTVRGAAIEPVAMSKKSNPAAAKRPAAADSANGKKGARKAQRKV